MTDDELVRMAQAGDLDAFDQLVLRHQSAVYRAALAALRVPEDAEEAAQDAFVRSWRSLRQFRRDSSFRTWLLTIVWRRALSRRRSVTGWWKRRAALESEVGLRSVGNPDAWLLADELHAHVARAIKALSPKLRDALLLAQAGEYDYEEIAAMLGTVQGTVKWRVSEARRKIREHLKTVGYVKS